MGFYQSLGGQLRLELTGADVKASLARIYEQGIELRQIQQEGELKVRFTAARRHYRSIEALARKRSDRLEILNKSGIFWSMKRLYGRPLLLAGTAVVLLLSLWLPGRILFVSVEGNHRLPESIIIESAEDCGIRFCASRRAVRSEQMKNRLLDRLPELQWAGVNTYGCRAVITVREREAETEQEPNSGIGSIIADRDGVVTSVTVTRGTGLCSVGQAVQRGQVLISGYTDLGTVIRATQAQGEIYAQTNRELRVYTLATSLKKVADDTVETKYSLVIGKKRINFYKGSGISGDSCGKMYTKYVLTLPGGFELPVLLVRETVTHYTTEPMQLSETEARTQLRCFARQYLPEHMIAGQIKDAGEVLRQAGERFELVGIYACEEMIGRRQEEMIGEYHGKDGGTDRQRGSGG